MIYAHTGQGIEPAQTAKDALPDKPRLSQIEDQHQLLYAQTAHLEDLVSALHGRLASVLRADEVANSAKVPAPPAESLCPAAEFLYENNTRLGYIQDAIRNILHRLEV